MSDRAFRSGSTLVRLTLAGLMLAGSLGAAAAAPHRSTGVSALQPAGDLPAAYSLRTPAPAMTSDQCAAIGSACLAVTGVGAVPDGRTDSLPAFREALDRMAAVRGTVFVPPGVYAVSDTVRVPAGVTLAGAGLRVTTLLLSWTHLAAFGNSFLIAPADQSAVDATVRDITVDGGRRASGCADGAYDGRCPRNAGGGIKVGTGWTVRQVRFTDLNYFKLWICGVSDVRILDNRFDNLDGAGAGDNDNIGGGCGASDLLLAGNSFAASIVGNVIDLVRASRVTVTRNTSRGGSLIFEGVSDSSITENQVLHGSINLKSNAAYASHATHGTINPRGILVSHNTVTDSPDWGINVVYRNGTDVSTSTPGGNNVIVGNRVIRAARVGVVISGTAAAKDAPDTIADNVLVDVNANAASGYDTGTGTFDPVGIGLSVGTRDRITSNTISDRRPVPLTVSGISVGAREAEHTPTATLVSGNRTSGTAGARTLQIRRRGVQS